MRERNRRRGLESVAASLAMSIVLLRATAQTAQSTATIRVTSNIVLLDTTVVDARGKPVEGLTEKDFAVYEDGKYQPLISFEGSAAHAPAPGSGRTMVFDPGKPAAFGSSPVTMLVLDEVNTHFSDSAYAVNMIGHYLAAQPETLKQPTTLLVVRDSRFEQLAPYTLDRNALIVALKAHRPEQAWQLEQSMSIGQGVAERLDRSLGAIEQLAQYSARIAGHKNLIWVGGGFPTIDPNSLSHGTAASIKAALQHLTDMLLGDRVTLYAVDPTTTAVGMTEITDPTQLAFAEAAAEGAGRQMDPFDQTLDFDALGPVTGGKVIRGLNDVDRQIAESVALGASYYTLGYRPSSDSTAAAKYRHIKVVCLRPGLTATTQDGYYAAPPATLQSREIAGDDLNNAATASIPLHEVDFTVERTSGDFVLHVHSADLSWTEAPGSGMKASVQVLVVALSARGKILGHTMHSETANAESGVDVRAPGQMVRFTIAPPPGNNADRLRFVVRDQATGRTGTFDLPAHP